MRKLTTLFFLLLAFCVAADETDWLNFATGRDGNVVESVFFRNQGRLMFGETGMVYEADDEYRSISYAGGVYIFFSAKPHTGIEDIRLESGPSLVYSKETQQIVVSGTDDVSQIRLVSLHGSVQRVSNGSQAISTAGLAPGILIATAVCKDKTITSKFIIK